MFNQLFKHPKILNRYFTAPLLKERLRYLTYRAKQEAAYAVLHKISNYQLSIIEYLHLKENGHIYTFKEIETAAKRWTRHQKRRLKGCKHAPCSRSKGCFIGYAKLWLKFLGRLEIPKQPPLPPQVTEFVDYMQKERNLSERTIYNHRWELQKFFSQIKEEPGQFLANLTPLQLDAIQIQKLKEGVYSRYTIRDRAATLRIFLRYAERQGWCRVGIADSIQAPRIYTHETLPPSPSWEDVQRLLKTTEGNRPVDIRARAVILLLAVYGLRDSEACRLQLEDFNWEQGTFRIKRSKRGPIQQFPLTQTVGRALIRYLKEVRPRQSTYREIFLTLKAPFRPMNSLSRIVSSHWKPLHVAIKYHGSHSLRYACATRLINQGMSLKTIADHLGHRNLESTRIYAKVDLPRLREVADFDLRGVL